MDEFREMARLQWDGIGDDVRFGFSLFVDDGEAELWIGAACALAEDGGKPPGSVLEFDGSDGHGRATDEAA